MPKSLRSIIALVFLPLTLLKTLFSLRRPRVFMLTFSLLFVALVTTKFLAFSMAGKALKNIPPPVLTVSVESLKKQPWIKTQREPAIIAAREHLSVMSKSQGFVSLVHVHTGELVEKDRPLVTLENKEQFFALEEGKAAEKLALASYNRAKDLFEQNIMTKQQYDEAQALWQQAHAHRQYLETLLDNTVIMAPFSGRINNVDLSPGQFIAIGQPLFDLTALSPYHVDFSLAESFFHESLLGKSCLVHIEDSQYQATIIQTTHIADKQTKRFGLTALLVEEPESVLIGSSASVDLSFQLQQESVFVLPLEYIDYTPLGPTVWTYQPDASGRSVAENILVRVVEQNSSLAVIEAPALEENMPIIIEGFQNLRRLSFVAPKETLKESKKDQFSTTFNDSSLLATQSIGELS